MSKRVMLKIILLLVFAGAGGNFFPQTIDERLAAVNEEIAGRQQGGAQGGNQDDNQGGEPANPREQELLAVIDGFKKIMDERSGDRNGHNGYNRYGPWWDREKTTGKAYAKKICIKHISRQMFGDEGAKLDAAFQEGFLDGLWPTLKGISTIAAVSGFIEAADDAVAKGGKRIFDAIGSQLSNAWSGFKRYAFHQGSKPINGFDLRRWGGTIKNMIEGLIEIADRAKASARIEPDIGLLHLNEFQKNEDDATSRDAGEQVEKPAPQKVVDKNWQEIAQGYLARILQMFAEMEFRQKYYGEPEKSEISFCLERLKIALVGDGISVITGEDGIIRPGGGLYACIDREKTFALSAKTVMMLESSKKYILGLLGELSIWVKAKRGEERKKNGYSTGNMYGSFDLDD